MKKITIYSSIICPYCIGAKRIFEKLNLRYQEILVDGDPVLRNEMRVKSNGKNTVPQIFFDDTLIGGFDELNSIFQKGKLKDFLET